MMQLPEQEFTMSVSTLLTRLEDRIEKRFDRVEAKMGDYAQRTDLAGLANKADIEALAERVKSIEQRAWDRDMVAAAKNHWPWIVALIIAAVNWFPHIWGK